MEDVTLVRGKERRDQRKSCQTIRRDLKVNGIFVNLTGYCCVD